MLWLSPVLSIFPRLSHCPDRPSLRSRLEFGRLLVGALLVLGINAYGAGAAARILHEPVAPIERASSPARRPDPPSMRPVSPRQREALPAPRAATGMSLSAPGTGHSLVASLFAHPLIVAASAFVLGGIAGAVTYVTLTPPRERIVYLDRPIAVPEPRPFILPIPDHRGDPVGTAERTPTSTPREAPIASSSAGATDLGGERALLDRARIALAQGNTADAERALAMHARRYPAGLLVEEREALAIKTLVDVGRAGDARRRAVRFKERFPSSIFLPAVDETLGAVP